MARLLYDLETNGLYDEVSTLHLIVTVDLVTEEFEAFVPPEWLARLGPPNQYGLKHIGTIEEGLAKLQDADYLAGHNILDYDNRVLEKLYPGRIDFAPKKLNDTMVTGKLVFSNIKTEDFARQRAADEKGQNPPIPKHLIGRHSLEAWGARMGAPKDDYSKRMKELGLDPWAEFNEEMFVYGIQDVRTNLRLWKAMRKRKPDPRSVELEMEVAAIIQEQERNGFPFDEKKAAVLYATLVQRRSELESQCADLFPDWWVSMGVQSRPKPQRLKRPDLGVVTREVRHKTTGKVLRTVEEPVTCDVTGDPYTKIKLRSFNPSSRADIESRLRKLYGWQPHEFTPDGGAKLDDEILLALPFEPCKLLSEYFMVEKRIAALAEGKQAWLRKVKNGRLHGRCNPNGTPTGRATHSDPNLSQVPSVTNADGKVPYGHECRDLFTTVSVIGLTAEEWVLVGTDVSGLELRALGANLMPYDKGVFAKEVLEGDIHWVNVLALGLVPAGTKRDKHSQEHENFRSLAKRFIYAFLYGAGPELIGLLFGVTPEQVERWGKTERIIKKLRKLGRTPNPVLVATIRKGELLIERFQERTPAIGELKAALTKEWKTLGFLRGLDGRPIYIRSQHSLLNFKLQSDGAIICKRWLVEKHRAYRARGWKNGEDYMQAVWSHDETQTQVRKEIAVEFGELDVECVSRVEKYFNYPVPLTGEYKIGNTWADTH